MAQQTGTHRSKSNAKKQETAPAPRPQDEDAEIQAFLDLFTSSITAGDTAATIDLFELPATVVGTDVMVITSSADLGKLFGGAKEAYNKRGITDTRGEIMRVDWVSDRVVMVDVRFPWLDGDGEEIGDESSTYTLCRNDHGDLKLRVIHMRGASEPN